MRRGAKHFPMRNIELAADVHKRATAHQLVSNYVVARQQTPDAVLRLYQKCEVQHHVEQRVRDRSPAEILLLEVVVLIGGILQQPIDVVFACAVRVDQSLFGKGGACQRDFSCPAE